MSVVADTSVVVKDGDGVTITFSGIIQWITTETEVTVVYVDVDGSETTLTLGTDYNITNIIQPDSENNIVGSYDLTTIGTSIPVPIPSGSHLYLLQNLENIQPAGLDAGNDFDLSTIERVLDRMTTVINQLKALVDRAVGKSLTSTDPKPTLPDAVDGELIGWDGFDLTNYDIPHPWPAPEDGKVLGWTGTSIANKTMLPSGSVTDASETTAGIIEIADETEGAAGTDDTKAMTPLKTASYVESYVETANLDTILFTITGDGTAVATGTSLRALYLPNAFTVTQVRASLAHAQNSGSLLTVDINADGTSILSTKITIDNNELRSSAAATPPVISTSSLADNTLLSIDVDQIGDGNAKGLKVYVTGYRTI